MQSSKSEKIEEKIGGFKGFLLYVVVCRKSFPIPLLAGAIAKIGCNRTVFSILNSIYTYIPQRCSNF